MEKIQKKIFIANNLCEITHGAFFDFSSTEKDYIVIFKEDNKPIDKIDNHYNNAIPIVIGFTKSVSESIICLLICNAITTELNPRLLVCE